MFKKIFVPNNDYSTYFVTDLHGDHTLLEKVKLALNYLGPDKNGNVRDRIFSCGDLIDRGPDSLRLLVLFSSQPDHESIIGNHEIMAYDGFYYQGKSLEHWLKSGGNWIDNHEPELVKPLLIKIATNTTFVVMT